MNRRNKRTSFSQYKYFLDTMEANPRLAANTLSRSFDAKKWKEMSIELNKCPLGPKLSPEEWRKRLNDWKNTTRSKYRRSIAAGDKGSSMTLLENRAMHIFYTEPSTLEPAEYDEFAEYEEEHEEQAEYIDEPQAQYEELEPEEEQAAEMLINGQLSTPERVRLQNTGQLVLEVPNLVPLNAPETEVPVSSFGREIEYQIKRISDIHEAALHFKIARFKYNNPGFEYNSEDI